MGGLLAADSLLEFINTRPDQLAPLWPNIIACIAFDTPVRMFPLYGLPVLIFVVSILVSTLGYSRTVQRRPPSTFRRLTRLPPGFSRPSHRPLRLRHHPLHREVRLLFFLHRHLQPCPRRLQAAGLSGHQRHML